MIRFFDMLFSLLAIIIMMPILMPVILLLRVTGEGEVFFVQQRVGQDQFKFPLIKFATMLKDSPNMGTGTITVKDDPRVLPVGRLLRKTKINELPQLINVLRGDMSIIGPRPLSESDFGLYPEDAKRKLSSVKPGLSGLGSIIFRDEELLIDNKPDPVQYYTDQIAPYKAKLEEYYVSNQSVRLYFLCIFLSAWVVISPSSKLIQLFFDDLPQPSKSLEQDFKKLF